ncbi:nucleic acid-binding, OB-fold-like protein [Tanacetum coccineum]
MYIACLNCNKNVHPIIKESAYHDRGYTVFECLECSVNFKCVAPRYMVQVTVFDEHTNTSTLLMLLDHQVTQIVGKSAYTLYDLFVDNRDKIPHELYDMVGNQWLFRLPKHQYNTFTDVPKIVSRILDDPALINVFNDIVASHSVSILI